MIIHCRYALLFQQMTPEEILELKQKSREAFAYKGPVRSSSLAALIVISINPESRLLLNFHFTRFKVGD